MKKIILIIAALALMASPAMAVDWNFYGSARMATYYNSRDFNNSAGDSLDDNGGLNLEPGFDDDDQLQWDLQGNSRLGATVRAENIRGRFEFGINEPSQGSTDNDTVSSRRIFGTWDFGAATLKVGKDYSPVKQFTSGQVFDGDAGLLGNGAAYGGRNGQIALSFGGFEIAAVTNNTASNIRNIDTGDLDDYLPRIEAAWGMSFDTWNFNIIGGFNWFEYEDAGADEEDVDVVSWLLGVDAGVNFGPAYIKAGVSGGTNWANAGWSGGEGGAAFDGDDDTDDVDTFMGHVVGGFKFTDQLTLEAGYGYQYNDSDAPGEDDSDTHAYYLQAVISLAPGVWIIPEIGGYNYGDEFVDGGGGRDAGDQIYAGAKWQIDF
jgi:hypothetical protein